jgi:hypothetical protein
MQFRLEADFLFEADDLADGEPSGSASTPPEIPSTPTFRSPFTARYRAANCRARWERAANCCACTRVVAE